MPRSRTVGAHLLRGLCAFALVAAALAGSGAYPTLRAAAALGALLLWRGCPACWLVGLVQAWRHRTAAKRPSSARSPSLPSHQP